MNNVEKPRGSFSESFEAPYAKPPSRSMPSLDSIRTIESLSANSPFFRKENYPRVHYHDRPHCPVHWLSARLDNSKRGMMLIVMVGLAIGLQHILREESSC